MTRLGLVALRRWTPKTRVGRYIASLRYTMVLGAGFVVQDLVFNDVATLLELGHDASVGGDVVMVVFGLKRFDKDDI